MRAAATRFRGRNSKDRLRGGRQSAPRGTRDALTLAPTNTGGGTAEGNTGARTHLGNNHHTLIARDDVELPEPAPVVTLKDRKALSCEELGRQLLGASPTVLPAGEHAR